jgi:hypothetical protein
MICLVSCNEISGVWALWGVVMFIWVVGNVVLNICC